MIGDALHELFLFLNLVSRESVGNKLSSSEVGVWFVCTLPPLQAPLRGTTLGMVVVVVKMGCGEGRVECL